MFKTDKIKEIKTDKVTDSAKTTETKSKVIGEFDRSDYNWKTLFSNFWQGLKFLFKKLFWILIIIALFFGVMYLFKDCQGPVHKINPYYNPLPENPIILPIEDAHVGKSDDGMSMIATDRLNVLLEQADEIKIFMKLYIITRI